MKGLCSEHQHRLVGLQEHREMERDDEESQKKKVIDGWEKLSRYPQQMYLLFVTVTIRQDSSGGCGADVFCNTRSRSKCIAEEPINQRGKGIMIL